MPKPCRNLIRRPVVQRVAKRKHADAKHSVEHFNPAMWQRQRTAHHANAQRTDGGRQDETMLQYALAKRQYAKADGKDQTDFMHRRMQQCTTSGGKQREDD